MSVSEPVFLREKTFDGYPEKDVLEFLLTTAGIRADIPAMITSLIESFGSIKAILEARPAQLMKVPGVTKKAATLLALVVPMAHHPHQTKTAHQGERE